MLIKKKTKEAIKSNSIESQKAILTETILPYKETPSKDMGGLAAHNLFLLFTADIIQENIEFTR